MKKFISILLTTLIIISLVGCSNSAEIDEKLQGVWECEGELYGTAYTFEDGKYKEYTVNILGERTYTGKYTIKNNGIYLGTESEPSITYTYDESTGELRMWDKNGNELKLFYSYND